MESMYSQAAVNQENFEEARPQESAVAERLDALDQELGSLMVDVANLEVRLHPVLVPDEDVTSKEPGGLSPVAVRVTDRLLASSTQVVRIQNRLRDILARCEL